MVIGLVLILYSKNREKERIFLEVNSSPGTEGIEDSTGQNIAKEVIKHFANEENRYSVPTECGFKEILTIKPFGELISKFDTGNSGMPVIHADKFQIEKNDTIKWSLLGKTITLKLLKLKKYR